ncbi:MAG: hypothetical protein H6718_20985 [Polyangiaceae bacterium]|nr:hypothetical protein [Myxococcales bacterium]MCB9587893.1 hypothetical protein [Polyangiaceae bacterium]MCB9608842.1 hypothetical protein [Polyangiaceae bacterium]
MLRSLAGCVSLALAFAVAGCGSESDTGGAGGSGGSAGVGGIGGTGGVLDPPEPPTAVTPPPVELPARPADFSLGPGFGTPGWRESTEPFCSPWVGNNMFTALWSTQDAVYLTIGMRCTTLLGGGIQEYCSAPEAAYQSLFVNQGQGWQAIHHFRDLYTPRPIGTQGSALLSMGIYQGACAVGKSTLDGNFECLGNRPAAHPVDAAARSEGVYQLESDGENGYALTRFADGAWTELTRVGAPDAPRTLLDLGSELLVAGDDAFVARIDPESGATQTVAAPPGIYEAGAVLPGGYALMGFQQGTYQLLMHKDQGWTPAGLSFGRYTALRSAPGSALYIADESKLYRVAETGQYETLLDLDPARIHDFRVNADDEIFLSLEYPELQQYQCGRFVMAWFDGSELHLM